MANLSEDLKIVISGDPSKFNKALDQVQEQTKRLEAGLSAATKISGAAFAALTGTVGGLIAAFREQELEENKTNALIKATGGAAGVTATQVFELATAYQQLTIYGDEVIIGAENILLGFNKIGKDAFPQATKAALDLATFMHTDLNSAALQLGKALQDPIEGLGALGRAGIKFSNEQQRQIAAFAATNEIGKAQTIILQALQSRIGGLAESAALGSGKIIQLKNAIGDVAEEIGRQLVPVVSKIASTLIPFFKALAESESFAKSAAATLLFTSTLAGLVLGVSATTLAIVKMFNIVRAALVVMGGVTLAAGAWAVAIGALLIVITDLALNWDKRVVQMNAAWKAFVDTVIGSGAKLEPILYNLLTGQWNKLGDNLSALGTEVGGFMAKYNANLAAGLKEGEDKQQKSKDTVKAINAKSQDEHLSSLTLFLETKKRLEDQYDKDKAEQLFNAQQSEFVSTQTHQNLLIEELNAFRNAQLEGKVSAQQLDAEQEVAFQTQLLELANQSRAAELNAHRQYLLDKATNQQKSDLQYLKDREKFGVAFAKINKVINSDYVQGAANAASELVQLQQSNNATLKTIGKIAAIADITIKTAQSAMNIYAGFSTIPIVGPALGIAGAAAAVAFGAERLSTVNAAAQGGMIRGPGSGTSDSIPTMLSNREFVTPAKNYEETINAVAEKRIRDNGDAPNGGGVMEVLIGFTDDAFRIIEEKLTERRVIGVGRGI